MLFTYIKYVIIIPILCFHVFTTMCLSLFFQKRDGGCMRYMFLICKYSHALHFTYLSETKKFLTFQANEILSSFDDRLRKYATKQLTKVRND